MDSHRTVLGVLFLVLGLMGLVGMLVVFTVFSIGSVILGTAALNDPDVPRVLAFLPAGFAIFICAAIAVGAVPSLIAGFGLLARRSWAPIWALIAGIVNLPSFPMGTAVGIYAIWVYLQGTTRESTDLIYGNSTVS